MSQRDDTNTRTHTPMMLSKDSKFHNLSVAANLHQYMCVSVCILVCACKIKQFVILLNFTLLFNLTLHFVRSWLNFCTQTIWANRFRFEGVQL